jgi:hypothetical protein
MLEFDLKELSDEKCKELEIYVIECLKINTLKQNEQKLILQQQQQQVLYQQAAHNQTPPPAFQ